MGRHDCRVRVQYIISTSWRHFFHMLVEIVFKKKVIVYQTEIAFFCSIGDILSELFTSVIFGCMFMNQIPLTDIQPPSFH